MPEQALRIAGRSLIPLLAGLLLFSYGCEPGTLNAGAVIDECFQGTFWDGPAFLRLTHEDGVVSATGSPSSGSDWEALSFTGHVGPRGTSSGQATVWRLTSDSRDEVRIPLELRLNEGADCNERDTLSYSFHFVSARDGSVIHGIFSGRREAE